MNDPSAGVGNRLLAALDPDDLDLLAPGFERVRLEAGQVLFHPGEDVTHAYFPDRPAVGALVLDLKKGGSAEAAIIGWEGALGGIVSAGAKPAFASGNVQLGGQAVRLPLDHLETCKQRSPAIRDHFARYADCLLAQVLQTVACNAAHELDARLARWLLALQDRTGSVELDITQAFIAEMLGVRRSYVTRILGELEKRAAVHRRRGQVLIVDRDRLKSCACECYGDLRRHFDRLLPGVYPG